ncbi:MAG: TrkA C-terminal domain-containing protein [Nitrospirae bacterium]|nr:TrkA C-terminal domain-containing protein [Candidatus Manganitrophaceae bacterium]
MGSWRRIKRDLALAAMGVQEATVAIAERVHQRVETVKTSLAMADLEQQIRQSQATLGEKIYRKLEAGVTDLDLLSKETELALLGKEIEALQAELTILEAHTAVDEPVHLFEQLLAQSDLVFQQVTVSEQFPWIGKPLREWALPEDMRILFVQKNSQVEIAYGGTIIGMHDQVAFIGPKSKTYLYKHFWITR